jgi:hypothetical protein
MRSLLSRRVSHLAACITLVVGLTGASYARTTDSVPFSGIVKDTVGNILEGVEVLVVDKSASVTPVATVKSDDGGRL